MLLSVLYVMHLSLSLNIYIYINAYVNISSFFQRAVASFPSFPSPSQLTPSLPPSPLLFFSTSSLFALQVRVNQFHVVVVIQMKCMCNL